MHELSSARVSPFLITLIRVSVKNRYDLIPQIKCGYTVQSQYSVQRDDFWFCWAVRNWSLFLVHPANWNKRMTSKNAQCSTWCRCWVFKISYKIGVLKQSQSALFCGVSLMTILFVFTCVMNVRYQSTPAFVTDFGPILLSIAQVYSDHRISGLPIRAKYKHFSTIFERTFWQFSHGFQFFFFEVMIINAWSWYFVELLSRFVRQLTISFHTFLRMTFHVTRPRRDTQIFRAWHFFNCSCRNSRFEHGSVIVHHIFAYFALSLSTSQVFMIEVRYWFSQINFFVEYFPHRINILFLSSQFDVIHIHW